MSTWIQSIIEFFQSYGTVGLFVLSFIEASFFPIPPYLLSIPMTIAKPELAFYYAGVGVAGSVLGGLLGYAIGFRLGRPLLAKLIPEKTLAKLEASFARNGGWAIAIGGMTPIPYKIFSIAAGVFRVRILTFVPASIIARSIRFVGEAILLVLYGQQVVQYVERFLGPGNLVLLVALAAIVWIMWHYGLTQKYLVPLFKKWQQLWEKLVEHLGQKAVPVGHFTWFLITGATLTIFGFLIFAKVAQEMLEKELHGFDQLIINFVMGFRTEWLTSLMKLVTTLGSTQIVILIVLGFTLLGWLLRRHWSEMVIYDLAVLGAYQLAQLLKVSFQRARPELEGLVVENGYSFPSGHSLVTMVMFAYLAYLVLRFLPSSWKRNLGIGILLLLPILVGLSRIYLGVHFPSDVLAGWAVGAAWVGTCIVGRELLWRKWIKM